MILDHKILMFFFRCNFCQKKDKFFNNNASALMIFL
jgi:hypothetical protein